MIHGSYVGVAEQPAVEIGEELWRQVELSLKRLLSKLAMEIMFEVDNVALLTVLVLITSAVQLSVLSEVKDFFVLKVPD